MKVLFLSYTGLAEPLGQSQVLPYVLGLARRGHDMWIVSFERGQETEAEQLRDRLVESGVRWSPLSYHKLPPVASTLYDVANACLVVRRAVRKAGVELVHARSHVPALAAELLRVTTGFPYVFDHRGLMAEEYADAGIWRRGGVLYTITTRMEQRFLAKAKGVVVLTRRLQSSLRDCQRCSVIPCAVDLSRFHPAGAETSTPRFDLVYAGSWKGLYATKRVLEFFKAFRGIFPQARMLLLIPRSSEPFAPTEGVDVRHPPPEEVPDLLRQARAGVSFRQAGRASIAASPVKVSEYLASGLPVVTNVGVGDLDDLLEPARAGIVVQDHGPSCLATAATRLAALLADPDTPERCRRLASSQFGLDAAVERYDRLYREIQRETSRERT